MTVANAARSDVRSFVDLRAFADAATLPDEWEGDAFLGRRALLPLAQGPVHVAMLCLDGAGEVVQLPTDEFVIVLAGSVRLGDMLLEAGDSAVLPAGAAFRWEASTDTGLIVMGCTGKPGGDAPVRIDHHATLEPSGAPLAELLVGPTPTCRNHTDYRSATAEFLCGTWDSTPYHRLPMRYVHYELMHLLQGSVSFEDEVGKAAQFRAGDVFLVEQGAQCSWRSEEQVKKVYAIYRPAA